MKITERIIRGMNDIIAACPYAIAGNKVLGKEESISGKSPTIETLQEHQIIRRVKLGCNISLIGIFSPFFWISLFSEASRNIIYFNAVNSGIVIALGYVIMIKGRIDLNRYRKIIENQSSEISRTSDVP